MARAYSHYRGATIRVRSAPELRHPVLRGESFPAVRKPGLRCCRQPGAVGGRCTLMPDVLGVREFKELPRGLFGSARANALAMVDQAYCCKTLIIGDLSNDLTYAEVL